MLISSGLMSLRATLTSLRKRTLEVKNPYQELIKEVFEYKKFNTKRPLEKFDRVKSDIISSKLFGFLEEYYPTVMYANKKVEQLSNKITVSHFEEGESSFSHLRSSLENLSDHLNKVHQLAIKLSGVRRPSTEDFDVWPVLETNSKILASLYENTNQNLVCLLYTSDAADE